ncbi:MAG: ComF family protein [Luteimonas sp.]
MPDRVNREPCLPVDGTHRRDPRWRLWRPRCQGCGERGTGARDLCAACDAALPRIRRACAGCGLPLPAAPPRGALARAGVADGVAPESGPASSQCGACRQTPPPLGRVVAPFLYAPPLDRWLPRFKFHHDLAAGRLLSQLMLAACADAPRPDALLPVPLHRTRLRARGYDQALELAKPLARALALPLRRDLLLRVRATSAQSTLAAAERQRNLRGAFALAANAKARALPAHVARVDDVMTTGATLHAAARALLDAGVERVDAWTCARAP